MAFSRVIALSMALVLGACANQDGLYEPRCIAYEGDRVSMLENRFEWQKFTDERAIDANGEIIDPFPGYPKVGSFESRMGRVEFRPDDGSAIDDHFIVEHLEDWYLMPQDEHQLFLTADELSSCALRRQPGEN